MAKLFNSISSDVLIYKISAEEYNELKHFKEVYIEEANEEMKELEDCDELASDLREAVETDEEALSIEKTGKQPSKSLDVSREELKWIYKKAGFPQREINKIYSLSREEVFDKKKGLLGIVMNPLENVMQGAKDTVQKWKSLGKLLVSGLTNDGREDMLALRNNITAGKVTFHDKIDTEVATKIKNRIGCLSIFEYSIGGDCSDFIEYLDKVLELYDPANGYIKNLQSWIRGTGKKDLENEFDLGRDDNSLELMDRIKYLDFKIDPKSKEIRLAIYNNLFTKKCMITTVYLDPTLQGYNFFKVDNETLDNSENLKIDPMTEEGALALIKYLEDNRRKIVNIVESSKRYESLRSGTQVGNILKNLAENYSNLQISSAKFMNALDRSVLINIGHIAELPKLITDIIKMFASSFPKKGDTEEDAGKPTDENTNNETEQVEETEKTNKGSEKIEGEPEYEKDTSE